MAFYMKMGSKSLKASGINMNGSPLPKVNCPDGTPPPCSKPSQASVDSKAQTKADQATKVYSGGSRSVVNNPNGTTTYNRTRNFTQDGEANESRPNNLPSYASVGVTKEEGDAYWASKRNSGTVSDSFTSVKLDRMPMIFNPAKITTTPPPPKSESKKALPPGTNVLGKGRKKITVKKPKLSLPLGDGSSSGSGCPGGKKNCGAVNK